jgi:hypothetical protein
MRMGRSRVELWLAIMYKIHSLSRADKGSLEAINELISHISDGKPLMALQDDEQLATVTQAVRSLQEVEEEPMH